MTARSAGQPLIRRATRSVQAAVTVPNMPTSRDYFGGLVARAFERGGFHTVCALLRVAGAHDPGWDPFDESLEAIGDYNRLLDHAGREIGTQAARRVALLMYCHLVEMSAAHELLFNLVRVAGGAGYKAFPFQHLRRRRNKKEAYPSIPPTAGAKFAAIRESAEQHGEAALLALLARVYNERIRNAVVHSDYVLTEEHFRWTEAGYADELPLREVDATVADCFEFYSALLSIRKHILSTLAKGRRFHKWPNYEVFELLSTPSDGVYGFKVHFPDGSFGRYSRRRGSAEAINMFFQKDGSVNFLCGSLGDRVPAYRVAGQVVSDWSALESLPRED